MAVQRFGWDGTNGDVWPDNTRLWTTTSVGGAGTADIQSDKGRLLTGATGNYQSAMRSRLNYPLADMDMTVRITPGQSWATEFFCSIGLGDAHDVGGVGLGQNWINGYRVEVEPTQSNHMEIFRFKASVSTSLAGSSTSPTFTGSNVIWLRFRKQGNWLATKTWDDQTVQPSDWTLKVFDTAGPSTTVMYPGLMCMNGALANARSVTLDSLTVDDLRPVKQRTNFRRS